MTAIEVPTSVTVLCGTVRPELACLGDLGAPLVAMLGVVERTGADRGTDALADPTFALDVLTAAGPGTDPAVVGRVLDFLRTRHAGGGLLSTNGGLRAAVAVPAVTLADAVASYEASVLALMAKGTGHTYRTWTRRLVDAHVDGSPRISGIECEFADGDLRFGSMPGARKRADLARDPRFALHGPTFHPEEGNEKDWPGEAKIAGRAIPGGPVATEESSEQPEGEMFVADITEVVITGLNAEATKLVVESWTPERGRRRVERA